MKVVERSCQTSSNPSFIPMNTFSKIFILLAVAALLVTGTSCHTVRGVGSDVRAVGNGIQRAAE